VTVNGTPGASLVEVVGFGTHGAAGRHLAGSPEEVEHAVEHAQMRGAVR
jgi:hypothetical protein